MEQLHLAERLILSVAAYRLDRRVCLRFESSWKLEALASRL